jgi:hypothetical protein
MAIAAGQLTIVDYNDALSLTGFINASLPKTQLYNPDIGTYNPDFTVDNMVLTASLFKMGTASDIINNAKSITWKDESGNVLLTNTDYLVSGKTLTIKNNVLNPAKDFICEVIYTDQNTGLDLEFIMSISLSRVTNGGGIVNAVAWTPEGNIFKNGLVSELVAECVLKRGTGVTDETNVSYQWQKYLGGTWSNISGATFKNLIVTPDDVTNIQQFKCIIKDLDPESNTYNQTFEDTVVFIDQSDPIQVMVESSAGNIFKNGVGSTDLTARLFRAGEEIDAAGVLYNYTWYKRDMNGELANFSDGSTSKTGKTLAVGDADVDIKATFTVEITQ